MKRRKRYTKKQQAKFLHLVEGYLEGRTQFDTTYGTFTISGYDANGNGLNIYGRFEDVAKLPKYTGVGQFVEPPRISLTAVNPFSGKWNHHFGPADAWPPENAYARFMVELDSIRLDMQDGA